MKCNERVVILTNMIMPYRSALYKALAGSMTQLYVLLSSAEIHEWDGRGPDGKSVIVVQKAWRWRWNYKNAYGFNDHSDIHIPYDTLFQLWSLKPKVVISSELGLRTAFSALYRMMMPGTKLILWATLSERTEASRGWLRAALRRWILRRVDAAFVNGESGKRYLCNFAFGQPIFKIPYAVDCAAFGGESAVPDDGICHLFCACQLVERKGLAPFIAVLSRWCADHPERRIELQIAGSGPELSRLQSIPLAANLEVKFIGQLGYDQIAIAFRKSSIFVFPTLADEWGMVVAEALSAGLPVMGSLYSQAVEELVKEGENGWLFLPDNAQSSYDAMNRALCLSAEALDSMRGPARLSVQHLASDLIAEKIVDAVCSLAESRA